MSTLSVAGPLQVEMFIRFGTRTPSKMKTEVRVGHFWQTFYTEKFI